MFGPSFFLPKVESDPKKFEKQTGKTPEEIAQELRRHSEEDEKACQNIQNLSKLVERLSDDGRKSAQEGGRRFTS